ncbi:hypothetical protein [Promicromonospora sp. NPDC050249]|uniref:hypothetical protein n=1 Tax=Promicromonospora sp. NPDC050249 TaxID=3154743 RepID=UPI0034062C4B
MEAEDWSVVVGAAAALFAGVALWISWLNVKTAREQAAVAREQTDLQRQIHQQTLEPNVWVDIRGDPSQGTALVLIVGNNGPTTARNVRVTFDPPLPDDAYHEATVAQDRLRQGVSAVAPGAQLWWTVGSALTIFGDESTDDAMRYTARITADGPFGEIAPDEYTINLDDLRHTRDEPPGSVHRLTRAVEKAGKAVAEAVKRAAPPPPLTIDRRR